MGGKIVQKTAMVSCDHQAQAQPQMLSTRVKVDGQPAVLVPQTYTVSGCPLNTSGNPTPCATLMFQQGTMRVRTDMQPLLLDSSTGTAIGPLPVQGGAQIKGVQSRVTAQ